MTVSSTVSRTTYIGSGDTGPFTIGFSILEKTHVKVIRVVIATDAETELTLDAGTDGYSVNTALTEITTTENVEATQRIVILRDVPLTQEIDYVANNAFPAETNERGLDKLTQITQQIQESISRVISLSAGSDDTLSLKDPTGNGGKFLQLNIAENLLDYATIVGDLTGVSITPGDAGKPVVVDSAETGFEVSDGAVLTDGDKVDITVSSGGDNWELNDNVVETNNIRNANVTSAKIADNAVGNTKLADMAANTVKVRSVDSTGNPSDLALSANQVVGRGATGNVAGLPIGTAANNLVRLDGSSRLPAVDGSQLTNIEAGIWKEIAVKTVSNAANLTFDNTEITDTYDIYRWIIVYAECHSAGTYLQWRPSTDNGTIYNNWDRAWIENIDSSAGVGANGTGITTSATPTNRLSAQMANQGSSYSLHGQVTVYNLRDTTYDKYTDATIFGGAINDLKRAKTNQLRNSATAINNVEFKMETGNITAKIVLQGMTLGT